MPDADTFKVTIDVKVAKDRAGSYGSEEAITYGQEFRIPAVGWTDVAKIFASLDKSVGDIQKRYPERSKGDLDPDMCARCGNQFPPGQICNRCK